MPFVKLDQGILDSSLWPDRDARDVFLTGLLLAEPYELTKPEMQIEVRSLQDADYQVPPGWYGFVRAASVGIARRAGLELEAGLSAIERLGQPDAESRSLAHDGRRMVRVNGGFLILNYMDYRDRDYSAAQRTAALRERKRTGVYGDMKEQEGRCACCHEPFEKPYHLYVVRDHCHKTQTGRGLICQSCNRIVGLIENHKPCCESKKQLCLQYLDRYQTKESHKESRDSHVASRIAVADAYADKTLKPLSAKSADEIYKHYPRKVGAKKAKEAIVKAIGRLLNSEAPDKLFTSADDAIVFLIQRTRMFAQSPAGRNGEYTPHPATWYNRSSYLDDELEWQKHGDTRPTYTQQRSANSKAAILAGLGLSPEPRDTPAPVPAGIRARDGGRPIESVLRELAARKSLDAAESVRGVVIEGRQVATPVRHSESSGGDTGKGLEGDIRASGQASGGS